MDKELFFGTKDNIGLIHVIIVMFVVLLLFGLFMYIVGYHIPNAKDKACQELGYDEYRPIGTFPTCLKQGEAQTVIMDCKGLPHHCEAEEIKVVGVWIR